MAASQTLWFARLTWARHAASCHFGIYAVTVCTGSNNCARAMFLGRLFSCLGIDRWRAGRATSRRSEPPSVFSNIKSQPAATINPVTRSAITFRRIVVKVTLFTFEFATEFGSAPGACNRRYAVFYRRDQRRQCRSCDGQACRNTRSGAQNAGLRREAGSRS